MNKLLTAIAIILIFAPTVLAEGVSEDPTKLLVPTLDKLNGQQIPGTDPAEYFPESAYTLNEKNSTGNNIITKYLKNPDGSLTEKFYEVTPKQTEYGDKAHHDNANNKYFRWTTNSDGRTELSTVAENDYDLIYYRNNSRSNGSRINSDQNGANITNNFIDLQEINTDRTTSGGAISNILSSKIGNITGDFIDNYSWSKRPSEVTAMAYGGAIYNYNSSTIGKITGDFIGNYSYSSGASFNHAAGGAISNWGGSKIDSITGNFIGNNVSAAAGGSSGDIIGGAIHNEGSSSIGKITGDFIGNYSYASFNSSAHGGAIYVYNATIDNITGNFIGNYVASETGGAIGGAIYNNKGTIGNITGDFIGSYAVSPQSSAAYGGAIYNHKNSTIKNITGDFIGNYAISSPITYGGAITNDENCTIGDITGDFISNYVSSVSSSGFGGAIHISQSKTGNITGDFIGNHVSANSNAFGGAIYIFNGVVGEISGSFINNYAVTTSNIAASGGAIWTNSDLNFLADNKQIEFTGNYTKDSANNTAPNAIWVFISSENSATITLKALNDGSITFNDQINGKGSLFHYSYNLALTGDNSGKIFFNNDIINANITLENIALYLGRDDVLNQSKTLTVNSGSLSMVNKQVGTFELDTLNLNSDLKLALDTDLSAQTTDVLKFDTISDPNTSNIHITELNVMGDMQSNGSFKSEFLQGTGADSINSSLASELSRIYTQLHVYDVEVNNNELTFVNRGEPTGLPGAIADDGNRTFTMYADESVTDWLAQTKNDMQGDNLIIQGNGNSVIGNNNIGIIVNNSQTLTVKDVESWRDFSSTEGGAINNNMGTINIIDSNFSDNTSSTDGGAINNNSGIVNIIAEKSHVTFENNTANGDSNAIHNINNATLNLNAFEELKIDTLEEYNIIFNDKITSDTSSVLNINASNTEVQSVSQSAPTNGTIVINNDMSGFKGDANLYNGTIKIAQNGIFFGAQNFNVHGGTLDLANGLTQATSFNNLNIVSNSLGLIIDADLAASTIDTISAANIISDADKINVTHINLLSDALKELTTLNFTDNSLKAAVTYTGKDVAYSNIYKYGVKFNNSTGNFEFSRYSPNTSDGFNPSILAAPVAAQLGGYLTQLNSYDQAFMNMDMYMLMTKEARQAMKLKNKYAAAGNAAMTFSPLNSRYEDKGIWFKPYSTFENVPLRRGPKVSNVAYGSFFGGDSELYDLGHGWDGMFSVYAGYNGSHQAYQGISMYQNGGTLGASGFAYKDNFFTGLTVNVGASAVDASTMFGSENFAMLMGGVASKTGYNWELAKGKFIIQPSYMMSYTFVNTFDYRNAAGVKMDADLLNAIQIEPGVKFIGNLKNGWQPYLGVSMVWNIMDRTKFHANDVSLPDLSVKPFVRYGVGIQKLWGERFTGYLQAFLTSGGRNGVGLSAGLRWRI